MNIRLKILGSTILASSLLGVMPVTALQAQAQQVGNSQDVLVMRRKINPAEIVRRGPEGTKVAINLGPLPEGGNRYRASGDVKLAVSALGCVINEALVGEDQCATSAQGASLGDVVTLPSRMDPDLKAVYVAREAFLEAMPYAPAESINTLCEGRIGIGAESWRLSCDPQAVVNQYKKYITRMGDPAAYPNQFPQNPNSSANLSYINLAVTDYGCQSTLTGSDLSRSNCSSLTRSPNIYDIVSLPAELVPELRKAYVTRDSIKNITGMKDAQIDAVCSTSITVQGQAWKVACGSAASPEDYIRTVHYLSDPTTAPSSMGNQYKKVNRTDGTIFSWMVSSTNCIDTNTKSATSLSNCQYLPTGANIYDVITVGATPVANLREIYFDEQDIKDISPYLQRIAGVDLVGFCTQAQSLSLHDGDGVEIKYAVKCGRPDSAANYDRYAYQMNDPYSTFPSSSPSTRTRNNNTRDSFDFHVGQTGCINLITKTEALELKCRYLPEGASYYDVATISATYVASFREIYFKRNEIEALFPYGGRIQDRNGLRKNPAEFCASGGSFDVLENGRIATYQAMCGQPDNPANYDRYAYSLNDPYSTFPSSSSSTRTRNNNTRDSFDFHVGQTGCRNLTTNTEASETKCRYLPEGASYYDASTISATYVADLREVYFKSNEIEALFPYGGVIRDRNNSSRSSTDFCKSGGSFDVLENGRIATYQARCGLPDNPANYDRYATRLNDPYDTYSSSNSSTRTRNTNTRNSFDFHVGQTGCKNIVTGAEENELKCRYLPDGKSVYQPVTVSVAYDNEMRTITFNRNELNSLFPYGGLFYDSARRSPNVNQLCTTGASFYVLDSNTRRMVTYSAICR